MIRRPSPQPLPHVKRHSSLGTAIAAVIGAVALSGLSHADTPVNTARTAGDSTEMAASGRPSGFVGPVLGDAWAPIAPVSAPLPAVATSVAPSAVPAPGQSIDATFTTALPDQRAAVAIRAALAQLGLPYVWGGDGPLAGEVGFDCSGLTTYAYGVAGVKLPRTAQTQYYAGPHVPAGAPLQPGDLVFYGTSLDVHHVGMYLGAGRMVNAPTFGKPVQVAYYRWVGDDYLGATRPSAVAGITIAPLPFVAAPPAAPPAPPVFAAPVAPLPPQLPAPTDPQPSEQDSAADALGNTEGAPEVTTTVPTPTRTAPTTVPPTSTIPTTTTPSTTVPTTTEPPASATTTAAATTVPATTVPATTAPATTAPATTAPAASATVQPVSTIAPRLTEVTLPGGTVELRAVSKGADGLPSGPGIVSSGGRSTIRLASAAPAAGAAPGSVITVKRADGTVHTFTVASSVTATSAEAAAASGSLVVLVPAGTDRWTVLVAA